MAETPALTDLDLFIEFGEQLHRTDPKFAETVINSVILAEAGEETPTYTP